MTFDEIVSEVCEKMNLTSDEAKSRVSRNVNTRFRRATSSIGMAPSRFVQVSTVATIGNRVLTFTGIEKIIAVIDKTSGIDIPLAQITTDEMHITVIKTDPPRKFAVQRMHNNSVDIIVNTTPSSNFTLYADGHVVLGTITGTQSPDFPESFHDCLVFGAMADEYRKMEKVQLAHDCEEDYERRLSDLRMWIAKSAYLDLYQGRYSGHNFRWTRDAQTNWDS
jgi:hypothetical protein